MSGYSQNFRYIMKLWKYLPFFRLHTYRVELVYFLVTLSDINFTHFFFFSRSFIALLAGTLRTYQKAGCDAEYISLSCPRGTSISIEIAQYGNMLKGI